MRQLIVFFPPALRQLCCLIFWALWCPANLQAQKNSADLLKEARKNLGVYRKNFSDGSLLQNARQSLDAAFLDPSLARDADALLLKGEIYQEVAEIEQKARLINKGNMLSPDNPALIAFESFQKAFSGGGLKKDMRATLLKKLAAIELILMNSLTGYYEHKNLTQSYNLARALFTNKQLLNNEGQTSTLDQPRDFEGALGALWALSKETGAVSRDTDFIADVILKGPETALSFAVYYELAVGKGNMQAAEEVARKGYDKFPDNPDMLFNLINVFVATKQYGSLVPLLKRGIELEPGNTGLYVLLAQVYETNYSKYGYEFDFNESVKYYTKAIEIKKDHADALYSLGALYFNRAARYSAELSQGGLSAEEQEKKVRELNKHMDLALPWFKKAEALNPNDINTLVALSNIYRHKGEAQLAGEFSKRLDNLKNGGKNSASYFKVQ